MNIIKTMIRAVFSKRFTFMLIPHGSGTPKQINFHLSHLLIFMASWTAVTFWGSYLSAQHIDYWRTKLSNQVLKMKVNYLVNQLDQSSGVLDEVRLLEAQLRDLLKYKDEASIIQENSPIKQAATGGPTLLDQNDVTLFLKTSEHDISWARLTERSDYLKSEAKRRIENYEDIERYIDHKRRLFHATPRGMPCRGPLTSYFGDRLDPITKEAEFHGGVDISGPIGTPVRSTADGVVRLASWHRGYGNLVVIEHQFGYSTRYAHNSKFVVKTGDRVTRGQVVALMGSTGHASGSHSHYEVWRNNQRMNPNLFLKETFPRGILTTKTLPKIFPTKTQQS